MIEFFMSIFVLLLAWISYRIGTGDWSAAYRDNHQVDDGRVTEVPVMPAAHLYEDPSTVATWANTTAD
jgi:hypothetical protein